RHRRRGRLVMESSSPARGLVPVIAVSMALACSGGDGAGPAPLAGRRAETLPHLGTSVLWPAYQALGEPAAALVAATEAYANAPEASQRDAAQAAFLALMERVQEVEVMQVGPLGAADLAPGGRD